MQPIQKPLLRMALAVRAELAGHRRRERLVELPTGDWHRCELALRQVRRAQLRGWQLAADALRIDLHYAITSMQAELASVVAELPAAPAADRVATNGDIYADLVALAGEFPELHFDRRARWLAVTTEPIELEGQYLGPFEIRLEWDRWQRGDAPAYRVIALEPHPANSRDTVTHPHVLDEVLCEGDGRLAIRRALAQGRLLDFFTLVATLLRNYNPESPFVELALWHGRSCSDCGTTVDEDESFTCQDCHALVCDECEVLCSGCEYSHCSGCMSTCSGCQDSYCAGCLEVCCGCQATVCSSCLHNDERCTNCHADDEPENDEPETTLAASAAPARAAV